VFTDARGVRAAGSVWTYGLYDPPGQRHGPGRSQRRGGSPAMATAVEWVAGSAASSGCRQWLL